MDTRSRDRAVLYARVSSKEQEKEGYSIPAQQRLLREYAQEHDLRIVEEFVDVETAKKAGRAAFGEMLAFLGQDRDCRIVLVEKTDRLYRNFKDWVLLDELDLQIHLVKQGSIASKGSRSSDKFFYAIQVVMAKNYIDNLAEETSKGMLEKAKQGIWPSRAPLGYVNVTDGSGRKCIEPDPEIAPIIRHLYERYSTGKHSIQDLTREARESGFAYRKSGGSVPRSQVHKILRNRIYSGDFDWNGKTYKGTFEPIVTKELWDRVQHVMDKRSRSAPTRSEHPFAFSGLVSCGYCGRLLVGERKKEKYVYYHCAGPNRTCPEPYVREEALEAHFAEALRALAFDEEVAEWIVDALRQSHEDEKRHHDAAVARLQGEYKRLQNRLDAMYVDKLDGVVDAAFYENKCAEWQEEQDKILGRIEDHQAANRSYLEEGGKLLDLARRAGELFEAQEVREKRRLLEFVLSNSVWKGGKLSVEYRQPFDLLAVTTARQPELQVAGSTQEAVSEKWLPE